MKAAVFKDVGKPLEVEVVADPTPEPSELVMKVHFCGICGTDLHATREGLTTACCGQILGHEYVGEIVEVGKEAEGDWKKGDRVCAMPFIACGHCLPCAAGHFFECTDKKVSGVDDQAGQVPEQPVDPFAYDDVLHIRAMKQRQGLTQFIAFRIPIHPDIMCRVLHRLDCVR